MLESVPILRFCIRVLVFLFRQKQVKTWSMRPIVSEPFPKSERSWREIADEASHERDPQRLAQLARELMRALDERDRKFPQTNRRGEAQINSKPGA